MTLPKSLQLVKPVPIGERFKDGEAYLASFEQRYGIVLPPLHREILVTFAAPIAFEVVCAYRPEQRSPWDREDGSQTLEALYGPSEGANSLNVVNKRLSERLPARTIAIGASSAGNQICLSFEAQHCGHVYFWDHEDEVVIGGSEADFANMYLISETFDDFIARLFPRDEARTSTDLGIVRSKTWLDF
jgi:hypothetical protein